MARKLILVLAILGMISGSAALDINDSDPLQYYSGGDLDFEIDQSGNADIRSNLIMGSGQEIQDYYDSTKCGEFRAVKGIHPNGTYICTDEILEEKTEYLNETLAAGNTAGRSINMTNRNIDQIKDLNSNGSSLNIGGDVDFEENIIQNIDAIQDGGSNSILLNEANDVKLPNGDLNITGGDVYLGDGSTGNPSISFLNQPDMGLQRQGPNDLQFVTNNDAQLRLTKNLVGVQGNYIDAVGGPNAAQSGAIRLSNNVDLTFRNGADSGDIAALSVDSNDNIELPGSNVEILNGNLEMEENNIQNISAIQDNSGIDSIVLNETNDVKLPNGNLDLDTNQIKNVDSISNGTSRTIEIEPDGDVNFSKGNISLEDNDINDIDQIRITDSSDSPGKKLLTVGDQAYLTDVDSANTLGVYGQGDSTKGIIDLGSSGPTVTGQSDGDLRTSGKFVVGGNKISDSGDTEILTATAGGRRNLQDGNGNSLLTVGGDVSSNTVGRTTIGNSTGSDTARFLDDNTVVIPNGNLEVGNSNSIQDDSENTHITFNDGGNTQIERDLQVDGTIVDGIGNGIIQPIYNGGRREFKDGAGNPLFIIGGNNSDTVNGQVTIIDSGNNEKIVSYDDGPVEIPNSNLQMNSNAISELGNLYDNDSTANFFQDSCSSGEVISGINADGSYDCSSSSSQIEDIWVNETGDSMTGTLNMTGDQVIEIGTERSNFTDSGGLDLGDRLDAGNNNIQNAPQVQNTDSIDLDIDSDSNSNSQTLEITKDGESTTLMRVNEDGTVEIPESSLNMEENSIENLTALYDNESTANFFQDACSSGDVIAGINPDGTYDCASSESQIEDIWVNETGDNMTGDLNLNENDLIEVDEIRTNGSGSDIIKIRDTANSRNLVEFRESGTIELGVDTGGNNVAIPEQGSNGNTFKVGIGSSSHTFEFDSGGGSDQTTIDSDGNFLANGNGNGGTARFEVNQDGGIVNYTNMEISSSPSAGTAQALQMGIDDTTMLNISAEADGSGGTQNRQIQVTNSDLVGDQGRLNWDSGSFNIVGSGLDDGSSAISLRPEGTQVLRLQGNGDSTFKNTDLTMRDGDLNMSDNSINNVSSLDGGGDQIQADDAINMNQNNVSDVNKVGFGDGNKIKTEGGRMCLGNRCS